MSAKARASLVWDDAHLIGALRPLKPLIRVLSSIPLAVSLLTIVAIFGVLASVPIGLLAQIPTWLGKAALFVILWAMVAGVPMAVVWRLFRARSKNGAFTATVVSAAFLSALAWWVWVRFAWPHLRFDPVSGSGLMFFAGFVERYKSTTLRRLPGIEMSEAEFYAWWPLRLVLTLFVVNLVTATLRRIEFTFRNIGVLSVHTGIILISLGSAYYGGLKLEGDTFLAAGPVDAKGQPGDGAPQSVYYDALRVSLFADQGRGWEQRPIRRLPRYNDYGLESAGKTLARAGEPPADDDTGADADVSARVDAPLRIDLETSSAGSIDDDFRFAVVGYASYAEGVERWITGEPGSGSPLTRVYLHSTLPTRDGSVSERPIFEFSLAPESPADRWTANDVFALELSSGETAGMSDQRWADLSSELPPGSRYGLVVDIPASGERRVLSVAEGTSLEVGGYAITVGRIESAPSLPIITPGYGGATSSLAVVNVRTPGGEAFERFVYHRFPELNQDLVAGTNSAGMPPRRAADPALRIGFIDASRLGVYIDQPPGKGLRAIVRQAGGAVRVTESTPETGPDAGWLRDIVPRISLRVGETDRDAAKRLAPLPIPENERTDKEATGTHQRALIAVEVRSTKNDWKIVRWLAFSRYLDPQTGPDIQSITTPDGRDLRLAFGRLQHGFPGFAIQYVDFEMIAYDFRGSPRDYQSTVRVVPVGRDFDPYVHVAKLNEPLRAPTSWDERKPWIVNISQRLLAGLDPRQFKLSQSGWDAQGWQQTQKLTDEGKASAPSVRFTILHVGNNPGIHIVALGAIFMVLGIPWAFYVKPWLLQREKRRIQGLVAEGRYVPPSRGKADAAHNGVHQGTSR